MFHSENERDIFKNSLCSSDHGKCSPDGLSLPTKDIITRKFNNAKPNKRLPDATIQQVIEQIETNWTPSSNDIGSYEEHIDKYEEIIKFEDWMIDENTQNGITIEITDDNWEQYKILIEHPDLLMKFSELEEEKLLEEEQKMKLTMKFDENDNIFNNINNNNNSSNENNINKPNTINENPENIGDNYDDGNEDDSESESDDDVIDFEAQLRARTQQNATDTTDIIDLNTNVDATLIIDNENIVIMDENEIDHNEDGVDGESEGETKDKNENELSDDGEDWMNVE